MQIHKKMDLIGKRFGKLVVVEQVGRTKSYDKLYLCQCDCGNQKIIRGQNLRRGHTKTCGCKEDKFINFVGKKVDDLFVLEYLGKKNRRAQYLCLCECGNYCIRSNASLLSKKHSSCGCYALNKITNLKKTHGCYSKNRRLHGIYKLMIARCYDSRSQNYNYYGKRGISVCDEWVNDERNFFKWALKHGYNDSFEIDRIDSNGNYCPENCRFIPYYMNRRRAVFKRDFGYDPTDEELIARYGDDLTRK